jgi:hypothetical protein
VTVRIDERSSAYPASASPRAEQRFPREVTIPTDNSLTSEGNVIAAKSAVSVSVIAGVPEAGERFVGEIKGKLNKLLR